jgi:catechol 2,3-dioxygenase-like lactoylglutathione lyase family enzyme
MYDRVTPTCQDWPVIDHFGIICADFGRSKEFYDAVLGELGYGRQMDVGPAIGYGRDRKPDFWLEDADGRGPTVPVHFAFQAAGTDQVKAFYAAALTFGVESLHEPRLWPEYHPGYFGAFVRDPDGNNVEAVFHGVTQAN